MCHYKRANSNQSRFLSWFNLSNCSISKCFLLLEFNHKNIGSVKKYLWIISLKLKGGLNLLSDKREAVIADHLFISYATEDHALTDWLALRLTLEGYKVWYDRLKLLGGESYPKDITHAIKYQTFRLLFIQSQNSIKKPNPIKEVTLASNISRERNVEFIIPLMTDDLKSSELNFLTADLVYIPFSDGWYNGLNLLLKKLQEINAPKDSKAGRGNVSEWIKLVESPEKKDEQIWSNLFRVKSLPKALQEYTQENDGEVLPSDINWVYFKLNNRIYSFEPPPESVPIGLNWTNSINYLLSNSEGERTSFEKISKNLILRHLNRACIEKGMKLVGQQPNTLYFPVGLIPENKLTFTSYRGRKNHFYVARLKKIRRIEKDQNSIVTRIYHHLTVHFKVLPGDADSYLVAMQLGLYLTDMEGNPLKPKSANSVRKAICKNWWNNEWLIRIIGVSYWLSNGKETITLTLGNFGELSLDSRPLKFKTNFGISERVAKDEENEDIIVTDEYNNEDEDEFENP